MGTIDVWIRGYIFDEQDLEDIYSQEVYENMALVEELTDFSLKNLEEDLDTYIYPEKKKEEEKEEKESVFDSLKDGFKTLGELFPGGKKKASKYQENKYYEEVKKTTINMSYALYDVFKKAHRMITW